MSSLQLFLIISYDFESDTYISCLGILIIAMYFYSKGVLLNHPYVQFSLGVFTA